MALNDEVLSELKDKLQITWDESDEQLTNMIVRGQKYFNNLCGITFTFETDSAERELLLERCRYEWNNALDDFENNFQKELGRLILMTAVDQYVPEGDDSDGT